MLKQEDTPLALASKLTAAASSSSSASTTINGANNNNNNNTATTDGQENKTTSDLSSQVAYDEDDNPIPVGIEEVDEKELAENGESLNLDLSKANSQVWLVKLPPRLAEVWKDEDIMDGRELGQIKIQKGSNPAKIFLDLNDKLPEHKRLDKEYQLKLIKPVVENEYVFSETELDHFKHRLMYRTQVAEMPFQPKLRNLNKESAQHAVKYTRKTKTFRREAPESGMGTTRVKKKKDKFKKFIPFAKTIPKKTDLVGKIAHEGQVIPVKLTLNNKFRLLEQKRRLAQMSKRRTITYVNNESAGILQSRAGPNINTGATIALSRELAAAKKEASKSDGRAARMDKDKLMKLLFSMFNEYDYWSLKSIREKTNQPEAYLKECLENIAVMERGGTFSLTYRLKDEYRKSRDVERKENGIEMDGDDDNKQLEEEDDVESDVEMEDVAHV
ncbi:unnamed protein product [Ambrosiozyma monospora]|uniref:Transcription initiation factor IIF subunit beta n=1 Tax=Ambrosiozyma monospora TaxID=43982 RepID=A0A9W6YQH6_AMBMO|nr:unnamed protein product [Ambrosiozyma monospora]